MNVQNQLYNNFLDNNPYFKNQKTLNDPNLKGFLLNNNIKKTLQSVVLNSSNAVNKKEQETQTQEGFNFKKALKPFILASALVVGSIIAISMILRGYSSSLSKKADLIQPEDLARNMNIVEEPEFAMFRALRDPSKKNILGFIGVGLMSGFTMGAKNFVDGYKEIYLKKQECDINQKFQKDLISVEKDAFSGKLKVIKDMENEALNYFNKQNINFKGNKQKPEKKDIKKYLLCAFGVLTTVALSFFVFKNYQKTLQNLNSYEEKFKDKLMTSDKMEIFSLSDKKLALHRLKEVLIATRADDKTIKEDVSKIQNITPQEIKDFIDEINSARIFSNADKALYGTSGKIQYYCYINENRGHLYNWILNPENKFNKYLFLSFSLISSIGYISKTALDALKNITVLKENTKSELNLRKKLVNIEIENFKAKKKSAIEPLIEEFDYKVKNNANAQELNQYAQNILTEIKNGPPYVYA